MAELTKEDLQAKLKEATENKDKYLKEVEDITKKIEEFGKVKQEELNTFTTEWNGVKDQAITRAVEFQGQIKMLEEMLASEELNKENLEISKDMVDENIMPKDIPEVK